jgi:uncharacterized protein (TIGR00106 family)
MSVILEFAMFPTNKDSGVSEYVGRILSMIRETSFSYQLTPMGTIVETENLTQALSIIEKAHALLKPDCNRVYCTAKFDIREGNTGRMVQKIQSVTNRIGEVKT